MAYQNNRNNRNRNVSHKPKIDINVEKANLPYTFVPVGSELTKPEEAKFNQLKKGDEELLSGHLDCKMYALNQLIVGNEHEEKQLNGEDKYTEIYPLKINNKTLISPYTLKGCVANFLAAYLAAKMKRLNEQKFSFRPNINFRSDVDIQLAFGVISENFGGNQDSLKIIKISDFIAPKYQTDRNTHKIIGSINEGIPIVFWEDRNNRPLSNLTNDDKLKGYLSKKPYFCSKKKYKFYRQRFVDFEKEANFTTFRYQNGIDGKSFLMSKCPSLKDFQKNGHNRISIRTSDIEDVEMQISKDTIKQFIETYNVLENYHLENYPSPLEKDEKKKLQKFFKNSKKIEKGEIIFFEYDKSNDNKIVTFGKTFYYPWAFEKGINQSDFSNDIRKESELTIIEEMFGYSFDDKKSGDKGSKSGKIHFNYAIPVSQYQTKPYILDRPGEPKPSSYEFYLQQKNDRKLQAYGEPLVSAENARLSGRKFYKTVVDAQLPTKNNPEKFNIKLTNVIEASVTNPVEFKVRVNFENLTKEELKLLKFALTLDDISIEDVQNRSKQKGKFFCHQIGYAKNYGIGAVKFLIEDSSKIYYGQDFQIKPLTKIQTSDLVHKLKSDENMKEAFGIHYKDFHYPGQQSLQDDSEKIIKWHSEVRQQYAKQRRKPHNPNTQQRNNHRNTFNSRNRSDNWKQYSKQKQNKTDDDNPFKNL
ncbi:MAG: hypothetical protein JXC36_07975 [Candidatus Atribacteria bacterium]|nr:hypothetical protein [Candidatus Atribacteria bacterium]